MDVTHPGSKALSDDQKTLLEEFRNKVESRISSHGLTAADVQSFVDEIKKHPEVSAALLEEIRSEVGKLMQGQRFSFDFDLITTGSVQPVWVSSVRPVWHRSA